MVFANLGVSMPVFVLGLLLAYLFAIVLKDTPLSLPPSGRLSSGISVEPLAVVWGLQDLDGSAAGDPRLRVRASTSFSALDHAASGTPAATRSAT